jgi:hypothetical protein
MVGMSEFIEHNDGFVEKKDYFLLLAEENLIPLIFNEKQE